MSIRSPRRWLLAAALVASAAVPVRAAEPDDDDLNAFQKKALNKMLHGNPTPEELRGLIDEMNKMMRKRFPDLQPFELPNAPRPAVTRNVVLPAAGALGLAPLPLLNRQPAPFQPELPRQGRVRPDVVPPAPADENAEVPDKQLKEFDDAIGRLKDNPEAQAELRKARDEYRKALAEGLRKNGGNVDPPREERRLPDLRRDVPFVRPPVIGLPRVPPLLDDPAPRFDRVELIRPNGPVRLGVVFEKPPAVLAEQLDLPPQVGVVIVEVQAGSPAEKAGLRKNDVLVRIGGKDAPSELLRFQALVAGLKGGEKLDVVLYRKGKKEIVTGLELPAVRAAVVE